MISGLTKMRDHVCKDIAFRLKVISTLMMKISRQDMEKRLAEKHVGLTCLELAVLRFIRNAPATMGEVSRQMMIAPPSLVPVIDALEGNGLVKKGSDPHDRRRNPLLITAPGKKLLAEVPAVGEEDILVNALSKFGEKKSAHVLQMMEEILTLVSGDELVCKRISETARNEQRHISISEDKRGVAR